MDRNFEPKAATGFPGVGWAELSGKPMFALWANQMAQTYRLAKFASLVPGLATLQHVRLFFADVPRDEVPKEVPNRAPGTTQGDLEELRAAWQEFEESKGDWSKGR